MTDPSCKWRHAIRKRRFTAGLSCVLPILLLAFPPAVRPATPDASEVRKHLVNAIGPIPWIPASGYRLSGQFILKVTGEEIPYRATYHRISNEWAADFLQTDHALNLRCGSSPRAWVSSPEVTADVLPEQLPFCAQYEFPLLYAELLRILATEKRGPDFRLESDGGEIAVRGRLWNGLQATYLFYAADYHPKKVSLFSAEGVHPAWLIPSFETNSPPSLERLPAGRSDRFEIWFSSFSDLGGYKLPMRTDYLAQAGMAGSFMLESSAPAQRTGLAAERPPDLPWADGVSFQPGWDLHQPSLFLSPADLPRFRARLSRQPWRDWRRANMMAAGWGTVALRLDRYLPGISSPLSLVLLLAVLPLGFVLLLWRRYRMFRQGVSVKTVLIAIFVWILILLSGIAQIQLANTADRSRIALHAAIRYTVTGNSIHAATAEELLQTLTQSLPSSMAAHADACQAYSLAYDLISPTLPRNRQAQIERGLYEYALPLYAALQGWRSNRSSGSRFAAAVGMAGLAIRCEAFVASARRAVEKLLNQQISGGLHREGPGPGAVALDAAANLLYALKRAGLADYYRSDAFLEYARTALLITSPVGTLPLFQGTSLDHAIHYVPFLLKAASHLPREIGGQCVTAYETYWRLGRYSTRGLAKLAADLVQPEWFFLANPYTFFEYEESVPAVSLPSTSAIVAGGQAAVLRAGSGGSSVYLALNSRRPLLAEPARDVLSFDLYAHNGLLVHGPGLPAPNHKAYAAVFHTASSNSITFNNLDQSGTQSMGIAAALLNQPLFDHVRIFADRAYDQGQVQRDVILVRPDKDHAAYFLLVDEIRAIDPKSRAQWYLHGLGEAQLGLDKLARWSCFAFEPPVLRSSRLFLTAYPIGMTGSARTEAGKLYYARPFFNRNSDTLIMEWNGSQRFGTALMPRTASMAEAAFNPIPGTDSCKIGLTDWLSFGTPETRSAAGPIRHASEYVVVRQRGSGFPGLLMIGGLEFSLGPHALAGTKPVFVSLDGLQGSLTNYRPDTRVELLSPDIEAGARFLLDEKEVVAAEAGKLVLSLGESGEHRLRRAP